MIQELKKRILDGGEITAAEALALCEVADERRQELLDAAGEITRARASRKFDTCSIVNARSGRCPENCKWCAQSAHYHTSADVYPLISREECMRHAFYNRDQGIMRFSLVTSGRKMSGKDLAQACGYIGELQRQGGLGLCASMGLLDRRELLMLKEAGVKRYHCNLEASPSFFPNLCSTHTIEDKLQTIREAKELGFEICSGGIIGMGETRRQRVELALELRKVEPCSIPINILCPIPGTPLENAEPLSDEEVLVSVALFRFVHPSVTLRFAGGRMKLGRAAQLAAMKIGINGAIVGDLLTTVGSRYADDCRLVSEAGYL